MKEIMLSLKVVINKTEENQAPFIYENERKNSTSHILVWNTSVLRCLLYSETNLNSSIHNRQFFSYSKHWTDRTVILSIQDFLGRKETCKQLTWAETLGFGIKHLLSINFSVLWSLTNCNPALFCVWAVCEVCGQCLTHIHSQIQMANAEKSVLICIGLFCSGCSAVWETVGWMVCPCSGRAVPCCKQQVILTVAGGCTQVWSGLWLSAPVPRCEHHCTGSFCTHLFSVLLSPQCSLSFCRGHFGSGSGLSVPYRGSATCFMSSLWPCRVLVQSWCSIQL